MAMKLFSGIGLLFVSAFMLIGFLSGAGADNGEAARWAAFFIAVVIPGVTGGVLLRSHLRGHGALPAGSEELKRTTIESELTKLAQLHGGKLTVIEAVAEAAVTAEDADAAFGRLVQRGLAEPEVTDSGLIVYVFGDIARLRDKPQSRGMLDA